MPGPGSVAVPKPEKLATTKRRAEREDAKQLKAFREAVWARDQVDVLIGDKVQVALCLNCGLLVYRKIYIPRGEVHHRIPRSICTPAQRYDPDNGVLLCGDCHGKAQRHEIVV